MVAAGEVDALQDLQLGEEVEGTEDRRPPDAEVARLGVLDEVVGREVAFAGGTSSATVRRGSVNR
jgi:hypothetical protein